MFNDAVLFSVPCLFGLVSAKWGMELGFSQLIQILLFIIGAALGPLVPFILYLRLLYLRREQKLPGAQFFGRPKEAI